MKTIFLFLVTIVAVASFGCEEVITDTETPKEQLGMMTYSDNFHSTNTIRLGDVFIDSISYWRTDDCVERTYFKVSQIKDYHYLFVLYNFYEGFKCSGIPISENMVYQCSPKQSGVYTLEFRDRQKSYFKTLVVK